jgi:hypothetical protein
MTQISTFLTNVTNYFQTTSPAPDLTSSPYFGSTANILTYAPDVANVEMPLLSIHVSSNGRGGALIDERITMTGKAGTRKESFVVNFDVFLRLTMQTQMGTPQFGAVQQSVVDLADGVRSKMLIDTSWGGAVMDGNLMIDGDWWEDPVRARIAGRSFLAWRWTIKVFPSFPTY